nr:1133_t:CDS:2 [Entrophospora candida]
MNPEISLYVDKAQLNDDEAYLILNPPSKLHVQMIKLISPNPNNVDSISIPKSQNCFFLYRKNYIAKHKSPRSNKDWKILSKEAGNAWNNESDKVKSYFKVLAKLALQKHRLTYESRLQKNCIFITQQPESQQKQIDNNGSAVSPSPYPHSSSFSPCINNNTSSQPELQQIQNHNNLHNNDCVVSIPPYPLMPYTNPPNLTLLQI